MPVEVVIEKWPRTEQAAENKGEKRGNQQWDFNKMRTFMRNRSGGKPFCMTVGRK